jgi:hypothetical protein
VSLQDYYAADLHGEVLPEEYVQRITLSRMEGDNLSPKLCVPATLGDRWREIVLLVGRIDPGRRRLFVPLKEQP